MGWTLEDLMDLEYRIYGVLLEELAREADAATRREIVH